MPNGLTHSIAGGLSGLAVAALDKDNDGNSQHNFYSIVMVALAGYGTKKVYYWEAENQFESALRSLSLCAGVAFLTHLILDTMTAKSLPLLGKLAN